MTCDKLHPVTCGSIIVGLSALLWADLLGDDFEFDGSSWVQTASDGLL